MQYLYSNMCDGLWEKCPLKASRSTYLKTFGCLWGIVEMVIIETLGVLSLALSFSLLLKCPFVASLCNGLSSRLDFILERLDISSFLSSGCSQLLFCDNTGEPHFAKNVLRTINSITIRDGLYRRPSIF